MTTFNIVRDSQKLETEQGYTFNRFRTSMVHCGKWASRTVTHVASEVSRLVSSVEGLSDAFRLGLMAHGVIKLAFGYVEESVNKVWSDMRTYRTVVDVTRIFTNLGYFLGGEFKRDIGKKKLFGIASSIMWTVINSITTFEYVFDNIMSKLSLRIHKISQSTLVHAIRHHMGVTTKGIIIGAVLTGSIESIRNICRGDGALVYNITRIATQIFDGIETFLEIIPIPIAPIVKASAGLAAASFGLMSFFLAPHS